MTGESIYIKEHKQIIEGVIHRGTATGGVAGTLVDTDIPDTYEDGTWKDEKLFIFAGTGAGQTRKISGYTKTTPARTFTVYDNWTTTPDTTSRYQVISGEGTVGAAAAGDATAANQVTIIADIGDFSGQANLQSLLAALGIPAVAGKPLYTCLVTDRLDNGDYGLLAIYNRVPSVSDVVLYPVALLAEATAITDDGTSPPYYFDAGQETGTSNNKNTPNVHWEVFISHFEREGAVNVISMFLELRWQHKTAANTARSMIQMSRDGSAWVDVTDEIPETNNTYQDKTRIGIGQFFTTIEAAEGKLGFRLISWNTTGGVDSSAQIRSDSYARITYRKS